MMEKALRKSILIVLSEDPAILRQLVQIAEQTHIVRATAESARAIAWLENDVTVAAIIVEETPNNGSGIEILEFARTARPQAQRILVTSYLDLSAIIAGLHSGAIGKIVSKTYLKADLGAALASDAGSTTMPEVAAHHSQPAGRSHNFS